MVGRDRQSGASTVAETVAEAEAWNERAALLSTLGFQLSELFGAPWSELPPVYLVRRLAGGASAANPQLVEDLRGELFAAAERARQEARALLAAVAKRAPRAQCPSFDGAGRVAPRIDPSTIKFRDAGDEIEPNPNCWPGRQMPLPSEMSPSLGELDDSDEQAGETPEPSRPARRSRRSPSSRTGAKQK